MIKSSVAIDTIDLWWPRCIPALAGELYQVLLYLYSAPWMAKSQTITISTGGLKWIVVTSGVWEMPCPFGYVHVGEVELHSQFTGSGV